MHNTINSNDGRCLRNFIKHANRNSIQNNSFTKFINLYNESKNKNTSKGQPPIFNKFKNDDKYIKNIQILPTQSEFE